MIQFALCRGEGTAGGDKEKKKKKELRTSSFLKGYDFLH
jgi:hypothetical protein